MADPIRVVHFADLHIGMENYGRLDPSTGTSSRVKDFLDRLDEVIDYAQSHQADLAVFAGDAFKSRDPDPTQQREFALRIKRLADAMPTLLLVGNHDMPGVSTKASSVDIFQALSVPGVTVGHRPEGRVIQTRRGPVFLAWMPYPMRNRLLAREEHQGKTIAELDATLRNLVTDIIRNLTAEAAQHEMPRMLAGHLTVDKAFFGSERSVMLGRDVAVMASTLADPTWDYVALGHIHRHQEINEGHSPPIVYSGSLERIDFGEEAEQKGFCWVELAGAATRWEFIPVAARPFHTVQVDIREESDPTAAILSAMQAVHSQGAVIRIQLQMNPQQQAGVRERDIEAALRDAVSVSIGREIETQARARLGDQAPESLTPLQLLEHYFQSRDESAGRIEALLAKAEVLLRDSG
jgi:exonuclease SbcD